VVAGLSSVHVVIGMSARDPPDYLVGIHVGRCAAARLENIDDEVSVVGAAGHFIGGYSDGFREIGGKFTQLSVDLRRRALDQPQRSKESSWETESTDREILNRALGLRSVQRVGGNANLAHGVVLDAIFHASMLTGLWSLQLLA